MPCPGSGCEIPHLFPGEFPIVTSSPEQDAQDEPSPPKRMIPNRRPWIVAGVVAILAFLYFAPGQFVAYTDDAYVRSDFIEVASEIAGVIDRVDVANDQRVVVGAPLAAIDPRPFELVRDLDQRRVDDAVAAAKVKRDQAQVLNADLDASQAAITLAQRDYDRYASLKNDQAISQAALDRATNERRKALDTVAGTEPNSASMRANWPRRWRRSILRKPSSPSLNIVSRGPNSSLRLPVTSPISTCVPAPTPARARPSSASSTIRAGGWWPISRNMWRRACNPACAPGSGSTVIRGGFFPLACPAWGAESPANRTQGACCPMWPPPPTGFASRAVCR